MNTLGADTILLDMDTHDANRLVLEPSFNYDNILQRNLSVYKVEVGTNKLRMTHLSKPEDMLQPKTNCDTWNPNINMRLRPYEIGTEDYEINGEQCPDMFDEGCLRNLRNATDEINQMSPEMDAIEGAMILQIRKGLVDDQYKIGWFGDTNFESRVADGEYNLDRFSPEQKKNFLQMMTVTHGWWAEIKGRADDSGEFTKIRTVDSYNGTQDGNATDPANIADFLRQMRISSHMILRYWNRNRPRSEWPCYLVCPALFDALEKYYQSLGTEMAHQHIIDGAAMPGVLMFEGFQVIEVPEWEMFDMKTGATVEGYAYSKHIRAIFTAKENLCAVTNMAGLEGRPESALIIQESPILKDKGKKYIYGGFGYGFGIAQPVLMTASWNSSFDFGQVA